MPNKKKTSATSATAAAAAATTGSDKKRVAVVGGGVAGLSAAWHLHSNTECTVHLFEAEDRLGGHAHTVNVNDGTTDGVNVDIGFMVFNHSNYPNMTKWFQELGVEEQDSDMSLSVSLDGGKSVEWSSDGLNGLFAKRTQALSPSFYSYISDMLRFNADAAALLRLHPDDPRRRVTTGQYLRDHRYREPFCVNYLLPMMAALWSASIQDVLAFPAEQLIGFLCNHKMLQLFDRPQVCARPHNGSNRRQRNVQWFILYLIRHFPFPFTVFPFFASMCTMTVTPCCCCCRPCPLSITPTRTHTHV